MGICVEVMVLEEQFTVTDCRAGQLYAHKGADIAVARSLAPPFVVERRFAIALSDDVLDGIYGFSKRDHLRNMNEDRETNFSVASLKLMKMHNIGSIIYLFRFQFRRKQHLKRPERW